jgi:hypothetical protein
MRLLPRNPHQVATVGSLLIDRTPEPTTTSTDVRSVAHRNPTINMQGKLKHNSILKKLTS